MARVTVSDCLDHIDNRFNLVLVAAKRTRQLMDGADAQLPWENDKPTVMALREIAEGLVGQSILDEVEEPLMEEEALVIESVAEGAEPEPPVAE